MTEVTQGHSSFITGLRRTHVRLSVLALVVVVSVAGLSTVSLAARQRVAASVSPHARATALTSDVALAVQHGRAVRVRPVSVVRHVAVTPTTTARHPRVARTVAPVTRRATVAPAPAPVRTRVAPQAPIARPRPTSTPRPITPRPTRPKVVTVAATTPALSSAAAALLAHLNPVANIAPSPNYLQSGNCSQTASGWSCDNPCVTSTLTWPSNTNDPACTNYLLSAINAARRIEGVAPMVLPSNWYGLTTSEQLFVVADLERTARGLTPYLGINAALSAAAQRAAATASDPSAAPGFPIATDAQGYEALDGTWSSGFSVLAADYVWMYNDGWGGANNTANIVCTSPTSSGCWSHRDELLGYAPGFDPGVGLDASNAEVGVGFAVANGSGSYVDLIEAPSGNPPAMTFTWAANVVPYL